jgi:chromosome partitioning protein
MRNCIAVMNTKGGVGKSTMVLALAETLSAHHGKNVLVIDSDSQASVSAMLMTTTSLHKLQTEGLTIVEYLIATVLNGQPVEWPRFVVRGVSDVDDARSVYLIPSDMQLTLLEREVSKESLHGQLRQSITQLLAQLRPVFDIVLIDCPPGLSVLTESWLREADYYISPTKADYISSCGLEVFRRFQSLNPEMGFAENLGVAVNMLDRYSPTDLQYLAWLRENPANNCFETAVPRSSALQDGARYQTQDRSWSAKYPGDTGTSIRTLTAELLARFGAVATRPASPGAGAAIKAAPPVKAPAAASAPQAIASPPRQAPPAAAPAAAPPPQRPPPPAPAARPAPPKPAPAASPGSTSGPAQPAAARLTPAAPPRQSAPAAAPPKSPAPTTPAAPPAAGPAPSAARAAAQAAAVSSATPGAAPPPTEPAD